MNYKNENPKPIEFIRVLCNDKTESEIQEAEQNFRDYLILVKEMCERIEKEEKEKSDFDQIEKSE